jgi:D-glycero-alpha-D-manno-heptose 1-phosphate guanylyltransferase
MLKLPDIIILAGGFGTRLQSVVKDWPKPMAPIAGKPFLEWLMGYLSPMNPHRFILSTGYKHELIENYFGKSYHGIPIQYCIEKEPLGTGGAIKKAMELVETDHCIVINGDTFIQLNFFDLMRFHEQNLFTMVLKQMPKPHRYGTVSIMKHEIKQFNEKNTQLQEGLINAGVYVINKKITPFFPELEKFSFEKDFMEKNTTAIGMRGFISTDYFIDIGIPEDYKKANEEFPKLFS